MIGQRFNFEDSFFRDLTVSVLDTLEGEIKWVNKFSSGDRVVNVPFYYSLTGDERFLLDSFSDDVVSDNRLVDLNTDIIPRAHITLTGYDIRSDEFANPNVWLRMVVEHDDEIRKVLAKIRAIPITAKYDLTILLSSEIDTFKCSQAIMDTIWLYRFMYFEHNFMNIDAVILIPDSNQIQIQREKNMTSDNSIKLTLSFEVQTYYPAYRKPTLPNAITYPLQTDYINKNISAKVQVSRGSIDNVIFTEYHNLVTSSDGMVYPLIGSGTRFDFTTDQEYSEVPVEPETFETHPTFDTSNKILDTNGDPITNQPINFKYLILKDKEDGQILYSEFISIQTNNLGNINHEVGLGQPLSGDLLGIDWNNGIYYLQIQIDLNLDDIYEILETRLFSAKFTGQIMKYEHNVSSNPEITVNQGVGVKVISLVNPLDLTTEFKKYSIHWPILPPPGTDKKTGLPFEYGVGSLENINYGDRIEKTISNRFDYRYTVVVKDVNQSTISQNDKRNWTFDYEEGVLVQSNVDINTTIIENIELYYRFDKPLQPKGMPQGGPVGSLLDLYNNPNGLRISIGIDPNGGDKYEYVIRAENFQVPELEIKRDSNSVDYGTGGAFQDTIISPKRTRWYYVNKSLQDPSNLDVGVPMGKNTNAGKLGK